MIKKKKTILLIGIFFLTFPFFVSADYAGDSEIFYVDPSYDLEERKRVEATLQKVGEKAYFYVERDWWNELGEKKEQEIRRMLQILDNELAYKIYPKLTEALGPEWTPGIDEDTKITVLIHSMREEAGGYFREADEYPREQSSRSNEREMIYVNAAHINTPLGKSFLAHELVHLITFNQKKKELGLEEEVWLNEARAEYAPTFLGYDDTYEGSNLQRRVEIFLNHPTDSLTEWKGKSSDYGVLNVFTQYLVEKYGSEILIDSMQLESVGIESLNLALEENDYQENLSQIFTDWTVTVFANDCSLGEVYCYSNPHLKEIRVTPAINFLPLEGKSTLGVTQSAKDWSGNWIKFVGSKGTLKVKVVGNPSRRFNIPYLVRDVSDEYQLDFFELDEYQRGEILVPDFGTQNIATVIIPSVQSENSDLSEPVSFFWEASTIKPEEKEPPTSVSLDKPLSEMSRQEIMTKITEVEEFLEALKDQLTALTPEEEEEPPIPFPLSCERFGEDLYFGMRNSEQVKCLQEFLKSQGEEIYPEGLVTGNFLSLTKAAVVRFQEKYQQEILSPLDLDQGTGYVGPKTREKINKMLAG